MDLYSCTESVFLLSEVSRIKSNIGGLRAVIIACNSCNGKAALVYAIVHEVKLPSDNSDNDARRGCTLVYSLSLLLSPECFRMHSFWVDYSSDFRVNNRNIVGNMS